MHEIRWNAALDGKRTNGFSGSTIRIPFQLNHRLTLEGPPPAASAAGCTVLILHVDAAGGSAWQTNKPDAGDLAMNAPWTILYEPSADHHYAEFTNLGSDGIAYVFIDRSKHPHEVKWFWNR